MDKFLDKKAVLFDHDGTLVDSEGIYYQLWCELLGENANGFTPKMYRDNCVGIPTKGNAEYLINTFSLDISKEALVAKRGELSGTYLSKHSFPLMEGARDVLTLLKECKYRLSIVSGSERSAVAKTIEAYDLGDTIEVLATGEQVNRNKPAPDVYLFCLEQMGLMAQECIAVEDTEHGVAAAVAAGIDVIAVPNQFTREHDFSLATMVLPDLYSLKSLL